MSTMTKLTKLRVHICPIGYEVDRIVKSAIKLRAEKIWIITEEYPKNKIDLFIKKVRSGVTKEKIEINMKEINRIDLFDNIRGIKDIFDLEAGNEIYVNISSGSKIQAIAGMMACMIFKSYNPIPYYVEPKKYGEAPDEPQSFGVKTIIPLPNYTIQQPNQNQIKALNIIKKSKKLNKKRFAELCINNKLFSTNNDKIGQNDYGKLNNQIITPLKNNWKYIKVEKIGHNDWITLTNSGNDVCKFLIEDVDITMSGIHN